MEKFTIEIKETLSKQIEINANSIEEAISKAKDLYKKEEVVLIAENHFETNFYQINEEPIIEEKYRLTNEIIDYLMVDEKRHFDEFENKPENHIYKKLIRLKEII